jgi:hypothetical protein
MRRSRCSAGRDGAEHRAGRRDSWSPLPSLPPRLEPEEAYQCGEAAGCRSESCLERGASQFESGKAAKESTEELQICADDREHAECLKNGEGLLTQEQVERGTNTGPLEVLRGLSGVSAQLVALRGENPHASDAELGEVAKNAQGDPTEDPWTTLRQDAAGSQLRE